MTVKPPRSSAAAFFMLKYLYGDKKTKNRRACFGGGRITDCRRERAYDWRGMRSGFWIIAATVERENAHGKRIG